jgi:hypothetical protein
MRASVRSLLLPPVSAARSRLAVNLAAAIALLGTWLPLAGARAQAADEAPAPTEARAPADVRALTRLVRRSSTAVTEAQASELTLTLTEAAVRPIQTWIRAAGALDATQRVLTVFLRSPEAELVQVGQRARCFTVTTRTQMQQARITKVTPAPGGAQVEATFAAPGRSGSARYLIEIVTERGPFLSVPNVSIIEEGGARVVYVQQASGEYAPRTIQTGIEGELYTQVVEGLAEGDQVVSIGSFFVDADNKLKGGSEAP